MADVTNTTRVRFWLWLIALVGIIVPRRLRADWRQEWEAELRYREMLLAEWDRLNWQNKLDLLRRSIGAFWDALLLQPRRLEDEMLQDLRFGVRMLLKNPGFTLIARFAGAAGIGAVPGRKVWQKTLLSAGLVFSLLFSSPVAGQQSKGLVEKEPLTFAELRKLVQELDKRLQAVRERGNTLTVLDALRGLENEYAAQGAAAHAALATRILTLAPEVGNYGEALRYADLAYGRHAMGRQAEADELKGFRPVVALDALARAAAATQVVMINEAHHVPQHRAFTLELLKRLRRQGFTHFAAETLYEADTRLNERGYPTAQTGFYTAEPVHGELIRSALRLGYRVVPYEAEAVTNADERERGQARNLIERILKSDPQARILIHAGYAHIDEKGADRVGAVTMAQRFKEATGIDPFTIDQTEMTEHSAPDYEHPLYRHVQSQRLAPQPMVFRNAQGRLWALETNRHDVTLFHPRSRYIDGRPDWLRLSGNRKPYRLPKQVCGAAARCLVRARALGEAADAIPIDQLEVSANRQASLLLPAGEFNLEVQDPEGKTIRNFRVSRRWPASSPPAGRRRLIRWIRSVTTEEKQLCDSQR